MAPSTRQDRRDRDGLRPQPAVAPAESRVVPADVPVTFFRLLKNLTADGYYTSRVGLLDELGYKGNTRSSRSRRARCRNSDGPASIGLPPF